MSFRPSKVLPWLCVWFGAALPSTLAQTPSSPPPGQSSDTSAAPVQQPSAPLRQSVPSSPQQSTPAPNTPVTPKDPYILEDGGYSIQPVYWLNHAQPNLNTGSTATAVTNFDYTGNANYSVGGEIGVPAGPQNTLRFSYFRVQGNSNTTLSQAETIFSEAYSTGDYVTGGYRLQNFKLTWDYLSYNWYKKPGTLRLKTLYELQYTTISGNFAAPFKAVTTDSSGNTDFNTATGSKNLIYPTFGLELEQAIGHRFRWEARASGFGLPHRAALWDAQATLAYRVGRSVEIMAGEKAFHLKTSPRQDAYFADTLSGAYVGVRYYWNRTE